MYLIEELEKIINYVYRLFENEKLKSNEFVVE
jgi:hypothetical protein